ncbi:IMPACT family protein [Pseudomarimonas salicorniae]|uniref:IMPACT family protein n=1 Tax=Pseudomarimonas salicorniae TaxID=2933270 RepID=A0ABT0GG32_9GAMM|nr:YigZ family protein [Lysobacter sp. CAU 1642]MCK7593159.1 IMPACT family protein [Lysobacter sp. CAU 1642]
MITLASPHSLELEVKKSRFLATAVPLDEGLPAEEALASACSADAHHNCWAWRFADAYRSFDDGEPGGTAGRPILAAIDGAGLDQVLVVVARWFGGVKLGAGGLVRAYGGAAAECLRQAPRRVVEARTRLRVEAGFEQVGMLYTLAARFAAEVMDEEHHSGGVRWELDLPADRAGDLVAALADATRGQARIIDDGH